jgi:hypothetical protein
MRCEFVVEGRTRPIGKQQLRDSYRRAESCNSIAAAAQPAVAHLTYVPAVTVGGGGPVGRRGEDGFKSDAVG